MFKYKIKWVIAFESLAALESQFAVRQTAVVPSQFGKILWVKHKDGFHAFKNKCPHQNKPMDQCWIDGGEIICPFHRFHFSIEDGRGMGSGMFKYECKVEDGRVWIGKEKLVLF